MSTVKNRSGKDLTEAERLKRGGKNTEGLLKKKGLNDPENYGDVATHLELNILECEVKWALGSITINGASGGDGIPAELLQILKDDTVKALHSLLQQKLSSDNTTVKRQLSVQSQKRTITKNVQTTVQLCSFHMLTRLCPKSFKLGFSST